MSLSHLVLGGVSMRHVSFKTPNLRRQAAAWLDRRNVRYYAGLTFVLTEEGGDELASARTASGFLLLPSLPDEHIAWTALQAGIYGTYYAECVTIGSRYGFYRARTVDALGAIRQPVIESLLAGRTHPTLLVEPVGSDAFMFKWRKDAENKSPIVR